MDALALLCNLYGDGPSTLKRLRAHGVLRIEDLSARQSGELASLLALTPATARRFLKEASDLEQRVLDNHDHAREAHRSPPFESREPLPNPPLDARESRSDRHADTRALHGDAGKLHRDRLADARAPHRDRPIDTPAPRSDRPIDTREPLPDRPFDAHEPLSDRPVARRARREGARGKEAMLAAAARRWTELDQSSPLFAAPPPVLAAPAPAVASSGTPLADLGLDPATHDALHAIGIRTLAELEDVDSEVLAAAAGLGISQVLFAQSLARRKSRERETRSADSASANASEELAEYVLQPGPHSDLRFSPSERPPAEWLSVASGEAGRTRDPALDEGAGPFA